MGGIMESALAFWAGLPAELQLTLTAVFKIVILLVPLILGVAYFTYWERKIIGWIQNRLGPNRVGWKGLLQPFADLIKMLFKEVIVPTNANRFLFIIAPLLTMIPENVVEELSPPAVSVPLPREIAPSPAMEPTV